MSTEHRALIGGRVRSGSGNGIIEMRAVTYNVVDEYKSVFLPGVFNASVANRMPVIAFGHDWGEPIGKGTAWKDTTVGPVLTARLDIGPEVPTGRRVYAQIRSGTLTDVSVGFSNIRRRRPTSEEVQRWPGCEEVIMTADLDEVSVVLRGAVPDAELLSVRGRGNGRVSVAEQQALDEMSEASVRLALGVGGNTGAYTAEQRRADQQTIEDCRRRLGWTR